MSSLDAGGVTVEAFKAATPERRWRFCASVEAEALALAGVTDVAEIPAGTAFALAILVSLLLRFGEWCRAVMAGGQEVWKLGYEVWVSHIAREVTVFAQLQVELRIMVAHGSWISVCNEQRCMAKGSSMST